MATKSWWDKFRLWFMPLGWRPEDRRNVFRKRVKAVDLVKYDTPVKPLAKYYLLFQIFVGLGLMFVTINLHWPLLVIERVGLTALLWLMITNWGGILEEKKWVQKTDLLFFGLLLMSLIYFTLKFHLEWAPPYITLLTVVALIAHFEWRLKGVQKVPRHFSTLQ